LLEIPIQRNLVTIVPVNGIVCEMARAILGTKPASRVSLRTEADQTVLVNVHLQGVEARNECKHSEVVLVSIDQVWIVDVVAGDV
jgi:hypothetical protein